MQKTAGFRIIKERGVQERGGHYRTLKQQGLFPTPRLFQNLVDGLPALRSALLRAAEVFDQPLLQRPQLLILRNEERRDPVEIDLRITPPQQFHNGKADQR